ncbi:hypothetical protein D3C76_102810 [compost metagenome]
MGEDFQTGKSFFSTELLVDGKNSGMFVNKDLFPLLKHFNGTLDDRATLEVHLWAMIKKMHSTALFDADIYVLRDFINDEIDNAK